MPTVPTAPKPTKCVRCGGPLDRPTRVAELELLTLCPTCCAQQSGDPGERVDG